jgi:hypothetical protein
MGYLGLGRTSPDLDEGGLGMKRAAMVAIVATALGGTLAMAATLPPWGGDDSGWLPPPKSPLEKCESTVAKKAAKLVQSITKCHQLRVQGKIDAAGEEACEDVARGKFGTTKTSGCAACTNLGGISSALEAFVDSATGAFFCQPGGTQIGSDDPGRIPTDAPKGPVTRCGLLLNKQAGVLAKKILVCHTKRAGGKLADETAEDSCEQKYTAKFQLVANKILATCDPCVDPAAIAAQIESGVDGHNGKIYCASPSSAFFSKQRGWLSSLF